MYKRKAEGDFASNSNGVLIIMIYTNRPLLRRIVRHNIDIPLAVAVVYTHSAIYSYLYNKSQIRRL